MPDDPTAAHPPDDEVPPLAVADPPPGDDWTAEEIAADEATTSPVEAGSIPIPEPSTWLPWLQARSPDDTICPFLRAAGSDDTIGFPVESPDASNRCAALGDPVPQSLRQQELVCLTTSHLNCPRYLRGAVVASEVQTPVVRPKPVLTPAISASLVILALSFGASVAFGLANGGLVLPEGALASPSASATVVAARPATTASPSLAPAVTVTPVPTPAASASRTALPTPSPTPEPTPKPTAKATPVPTSGRYALLDPCPNKPKCWIYTIRSGDNLFSIANYFGVPLKRVKTLNPWTETKRLKAGQKLILPPPTR